MFLGSFLGRVINEDGRVVVILRSFTESLGAYLASRLADIPEAPVITYGLPGAAEGKNAVSIYLCTITEDTALRSFDKNYERIAGAWVSTPMPLRLKCGYIVSAWPAVTAAVATADATAASVAAADASEAALTRQNMLSAVYGVLSSMSTVPSAFLPASLKTDDLQKPVIAISDSALFKDPTFWTSIGCAYQPSFYFNATVSLPVAEEHYDHVVEGLDITYKNGLVV